MALETGSSLHETRRFGVGHQIWQAILDRVNTYRALTTNTKIEPPYLLMAEGTKMILWFAMLNNPDNMDSVEISSNASVASLRLLLKSQNENTFRDIDALNIKLWQVGTFSVCGYVVVHFVHLIVTKFLANAKPS